MSVSLLCSFSYICIYFIYIYAFLYMGKIRICVVCIYTTYITCLSANCTTYQKECKADIRNPLSLLAHERSRFATCQWELLTPTDISIPLTHRLVLYALEAGECLFCVQISSVYNFLIFSAMINLCVNPTDFSLISPSLKYSNVGTELISYSSARDS